MWCYFFLMCFCRYIIYWYLLFIYVISELVFKIFLKMIYFEYVLLLYGNLLELYLIWFFFFEVEENIFFILISKSD